MDAIFQALAVQRWEPAVKIPVKLMVTLPPVDTCNPVFAGSDSPIQKLLALGKNARFPATLLPLFVRVCALYQSAQEHPELPPPYQPTTTYGFGTTHAFQMPDLMTTMRKPYDLR
jgi:hypothetical protein